MLCQVGICPSSVRGVPSTSESSCNVLCLTIFTPIAPIPKAPTIATVPTTSEWWGAEGSTLVSCPATVFDT